MVDAATRKSLSAIPLLKTKAGPRDKQQWPTRLKEELQSLIEVSSEMFSRNLMANFSSVCEEE